MKGWGPRGPLVVALLIALGAGSPGRAAETPSGLAGLRRVSVSVDLEHLIDPVSIEDLVARVEDALRGAEPPVGVHESASDRVRLTVAVGPVTATALRGFWLPLSGTYAIGSIRLGVERMVTLPGSPRAFPAVVWQSERTLAGPWRTAGAGTMQLVEEMLAELLEARRQLR